MRMVWYVLAGSAVGGGARYLLSTYVQTRSGATFPIGTLVVNILGSVIIGFVLRYAIDSSAVTPEIRALLTTGFCGGFTTFSTFSYESVRLLQEGDYHRAAWYVALSLIMCLTATFLGFGLASEVLAIRRRL
jgi:CrcB protein